MPKKSLNVEMMESAVNELLIGMGLDPNKEEGLRETPRRVVGYLMEICNGGKKPDYEKLLGEGFDTDAESNSMVVQDKIPFRMACEHHLLPAMGTASIGYIPGNRVIGLSKLARLVRAVGSERPSLQEVICDKISTLLNNHLSPKGVITVIRAEHTCMTCRGVMTPGVVTSTSSVRGIFRDVPAAREEFFNLISTK